MPHREGAPVARVSLGLSPGLAVSIYGDTASEAGIPTVELVGALEGLWLMKPETAEQIAAGLMLAARVARGEVLPTALDQFLEKRKA